MWNQSIMEKIIGVSMIVVGTLIAVGSAVLTVWLGTAIGMSTSQALSAILFLPYSGLPFVSGIIIAVGGLFIAKDD